MRGYIARKHPGFSGYAKAAQVDVIETAVKRNNRFRETLTKAVFALMTGREKEFARLNRKDVAGRLSQLLIERFVSQRENLL
jgi:hypothetical protein